VLLPVAAVKLAARIRVALPPQVHLAALQLPVLAPRTAATVVLVEPLAVLVVMVQTEPLREAVAAAAEPEAQPTARVAAVPGGKPSSMIFPHVLLCCWDAVKC
jgi:hypothetical protein